MAETSMGTSTGQICTSTSSFPIEKVGYSYTHTQSMQGFLIKTGMGSGQYLRGQVYLPSQGILDTIVKSLRAFRLSEQNEYVPSENKKPICKCETRVSTASGVIPNRQIHSDPRVTTKRSFPIPMQNITSRLSQTHSNFLYFSLFIPFVGPNTNINEFFLHYSYQKTLNPKASTLED